MDARYFRIFAAYNRWANRRLYKACAELSDQDYYRDAGAFFGSIHGTLNHLLVGDRIWMARLEHVEAGIDRLDATLCETFSELFATRQAEDARIIAFVGGLADADLAETLSYSTTAGTPQETQIGLVLGHMFNHETHHRGQTHDLLSQAGEDPPPLDLIYFTRDPEFAQVP